MAGEQDWCLQCGAGAPGSLGTPNWRSAMAILGATALLVLIAAAAAYAALSHSNSKAPASSVTVARVTPPAATTPSTPGATATTPPPGTTGATPTPEASPPLGTVKAPKIPLTAITPNTTTTTTPSGSTGTSTATTPSNQSTGGANATSEESTNTAILLDTNAASTYNPYAYPASGFGDPSLAIDGDGTTAWTAKLDPTTAPRMAQGLLINLKAKQKLSSVGLITSTPGMTVQVYGANGHTAPPSITDPAWVALSRSVTVKKKHSKIKLRDANKTFTFVTLWISRAPESSAGTPEAPGHVDINELELFPAG